MIEERISEQLLWFKQLDARNHLVFTHSCLPGFKELNVGRTLSDWLKNKDLNPRVINLELSDYLGNLLDNSFLDNTVGRYLLLSNIGILFEPALKLNVLNLWDKYSTRKTLFILSDGVIVNSIYYFLSLHDKYQVNLSDITYIQIYNE